MKLLAIDSTGLVASVAVMEDDVLLGEFTLNYKKTHSQTLLPLMDELKRMLELDLDTLDAIAVAAGPGSFTGLRIGSATAKGLGLALSIPLIAIPTVDALAANLWGSQTLVCPLMDARRGQTYTGLYRYVAGDAKSAGLRLPGDMLLEAAVPQCAVDVSEILAKINDLGEPVTFLGDGVPVFSQTIKEKVKVPYHFAPAGLNHQRAAAVALIGETYFNNGDIVTAADFRPIYLRLSQAERERNEDAKRLAEIASAVFHHGWSTEEFLDAMGSDTKVCLLQRDEKNIPIGYCILGYAADEGEILSIAVAEPHQKQGVGEWLLRQAFLKAESLGLQKIYLEVRATNAPAIALYQKTGFHQEGIRKGYYQEIGEDAFIMSKAIGE